MNAIRPDYEFPIEGRAWTAGALPTAGMYLLDGRCHIVAHGGPAALELESRGALLFALVRFDADHAEGTIPGRAVRLVGAREALARFPDEEAAPRPAGDRLRGAAGGARVDP